jgi:hypothetical protein
MTRNAAARLPSEVAKASKEIPSQERRQICINRAIPADFNRHAVRELEPLAIIYRQWPAAVHCMSLPRLLTSATIAFDSHEVIRQSDSFRCGSGNSCEFRPHQ